MRIRYFSWLALALAAAFLVVASTAFAAVDIANVALGIGIGALVLSLFVSYRYRAHRASLMTGACSAAVSAWTVVASTVFPLQTVQNLTLAEGLALGLLATIGLTTNELRSEHVVHSLRVAAAHDGSANGSNRAERVPA
jgi:hypothetical protein